MLKLLLYLKDEAAPLLVAEPAVLVQEWEQSSGVRLAEKQREAVEAALSLRKDLLFMTSVKKHRFNAETRRTWSYS